MINTRLTRNAAQLHWLCLVLTSLLCLSGCDGGIFGTGDGGKDTAVIGAEPDNELSNSDDTGGTTDGTSAPVDIEDNPDATNDLSPDSLRTESFTNTIAVSNRADALLRLVNVVQGGPDLVAVNNSMVESPLQSLSGAVMSIPVGNYQSLGSVANDLQLYDRDAFDQSRFADYLLRINPLTLNTGSATLVLIRGTVEDQAFPQELVVAPVVLPADRELAHVRVIHAAARQAQNPGIDVELLADDFSSQAIATDLRYEAPVVEYQAVPTGNYSVAVSLDGGAQSQAIPLQLEPGSATTLIISDTTSVNAGFPFHVTVVYDSVFP